MTDQPPPPGGSYPPPPPSRGSSGGHEPQSGRHEAPSAPSAPEGGAATPSSPSRPPPPPPPGGGSYPPPPPPSGGYAPPPPGPAIRTLPKQEYTPWSSRVLAFVIDILPYVIVQSIVTVILGTPQRNFCVTHFPPYANQVCFTEISVVDVLAQGFATVLGLLYLIWNYGYRQGTTGSSIGKSVTNFKVVSEITGQPLGFGKSVLRSLAHFVDAIPCFVGFLFPLWDSKRQTLADKLMSTVCLPIGGR